MTVISHSWNKNKIQHKQLSQLNSLLCAVHFVPNSTETEWTRGRKIRWMLLFHDLFKHSNYIHLIYSNWTCSHALKLYYRVRMLISCCRVCCFLHFFSIFWYGRITFHCYFKSQPLTIPSSKHAKMWLIKKMFEKLNQIIFVMETEKKETKRTRALFVSFYVYGRGLS